MWAKTLIWRIRKNLSRKVSVKTSFLVALKENIEVLGRMPTFLKSPEFLFFHLDSYKDIYRLGAYQKEPETTEWMKKCSPDEVLYDIGASNGVYSLLAAIHGASVYAFESDPKVYGMLSRNISANSLGGAVLPFPVSLGDTTDKGTIRLDDAVNAFGFKKPQKMKIDVDGNEVRVLKGARDTLETVKSLFIEIDDMNKEECFRLLARFTLKFQTRKKAGKPNMYLFEK